MPRDLLQTAVLIERARWIEHRLFEILGGFATTDDDPGAAAMFGTHGHQHAWHAELWRDRSPRLNGLDPAATAAPGELAAALDQVASTTGTAERLAVVYRGLLPRVHAWYSDWLRTVDPLLDAPTARVLTLAGRDDTDQVEAANRELIRVLSSAEAARRAAERLGDVEAGLVAAGGLTAGLDTPAD